MKSILSSSMAHLTLEAAANLATIPGTYIHCDADRLTAARISPVNMAQRRQWRASQLLALRAPANRSALRGMEFLVLHAIGRNAWNKGVSAPVNLDVYASESDYQAEIWRGAMSQMRAFYQQATKRKGVVF